MMLRTVLSVTAAFVVLSISPGLSASEWHVDDSVAQSGDGTSWEDAFKAIQEGINASTDGDTVNVAEGIYFENISFNGINIVLKSADPLDPNVVQHTIIYGNQAGSVVTFDGTENQTCVLSGFTIRKGKTQYYGAGVCGGTMFGDQSNARIRKCVISGNHGCGLSFCRGMIDGNMVTDNSRCGLSDCHGIITNNVISQNRDGGLFACHGSIQNNTICGNRTRQWGAGLKYCNGVIEGNLIVMNTAESDGGGMGGCDGIIRNNIIAGNKTEDGSDGGGLYSCNGLICSNTIVGNRAVGYRVVQVPWGEECFYGEGGGLWYCSGTVRNCIIWANTASGEGDQVRGGSAPIFSCIQDWGAGGEGNIVEDPEFVDADGLDDDPETYLDNSYRLAAASPCINTGRNENWMLDAVDLDGNPRIWDATVDMGSYEYGSFPFMITRVLPALTWRSRPGDTYTVQSCSDLSSAVWGVEGTIPSQGEFTSWSDPDMIAPQKFYRIGIE